MKGVARVLLALVGGCGILFACVTPPDPSGSENDGGGGSSSGGEGGARDSGGEADGGGEGDGSSAGDAGGADAAGEGDGDAGGSDAGGSDAGEDAGEGDAGPTCASDGWTGVPAFGGACPAPSGPIQACASCTPSDTQYFDTLCPTGGAPAFRRVDTQHDPTGCGACNTKCTTGQVCLSGACAPEANARLATGFGKLEDIVVDATNLYVADSTNDEVWQIVKATGQKTLLASNQASPYRIALDAQWVYWTNKNGGIGRAPIGGATPATTLYPANAPRGIAVDGTHLYWTEGAGLGQLTKAPKAPGAPGCGGVGAFQANTSSDYVTIDGTRVYGFRGSNCNVASMPSAWGVDKTTTAETSYSVCSALAIGSPLLTGLGVDAANLYFFDEKGGDNLTLYKKDKATNTLQETRQICGNYMGMASCIPAPYVQLTADACGLYWAASNAIYRLLPADRVARRIFVGITSNPVTRIAVDDVYVYWADTSGYVGRVAK